MKTIDIIMLVIAFLILGLAVAHLIYRKVKGKSVTCDCGHKVIDGKSLVEEYHKTYSDSCCCHCQNKKEE